MIHESQKRMKILENLIQALNHKVIQDEYSTASSECETISSKARLSEKSNLIEVKNNNSMNDNKVVVSTSNDMQVSREEKKARYGDTSSETISKEKQISIEENGELKLRNGVVKSELEEIESVQRKKGISTVQNNNEAIFFENENLKQDF